MKRFLIATAAGFAMLGVGAAHAQQNVCQPNLAQALSTYGVNVSDMSNTSWTTTRWAHPGDDDGPISGYQFSGTPKSCTSGSLYVSMDTGCTVTNMHTGGGCKIKGVPDHWW